MALWLCSSNSNAACSNVPVKRRVVVTWIGLANAPAYMNSAKLIYDYSLKNAQQNFLALDASKTQTVAAWPQASSRMKVFKAVPGDGGLKDIERAIQEDVKSFTAKNPKFSAESYELVFFVSNHGSVHSGKDGKAYSIVGQHTDTGATNNLYQNHLEEFARSLPKGIKAKFIFGQCFGNDTLNHVVDAMDQDRCACGVSLAAAGMPSAYDDSKNPESAPGWEGKLAAIASRGKSLTDSEWDAAIGGGTTAELHGSRLMERMHGESEFTTAWENWMGSTSASFALRKLAENPQVRKVVQLDEGESLDTGKFDDLAQEVYDLLTKQTPQKIIKDANSPDAGALDRYTLKLLGKNSSGDPERDHQTVLDLTRAKRAEFSEARMKDSDIDRIVRQLALKKKLWRDLLSQQTPEATALRDAAWREKNALHEAQMEKLSNLTALDDLYSKSDLNSIITARLASRGLLERAFLASASSADKARFLTLKACELQSIGQAEIDQAPEKSRDGTH